MSVVSVKISDKTKKQMEESKDKVEWHSEIRAFIENRLEQGETKPWSAPRMCSGGTPK